jgi:[acyl-carrier-protein] S-malonyltransferase
MARMRDAGVALFVEVGPGKVLAGIQRKVLPKDHPAQICNVGSLAQLEEFLKRPA